MAEEIVAVASLKKMERMAQKSAASGKTPEAVKPVSEAWWIAPAAPKSLKP